MSKSTQRLTSSLTLEDRSLWFGSITLYDDEVLIQGLSWTGQVRDRIPIEEIDQVEKWTVGHGPNVRLSFNNGRPSVFGRIHDGAKYWEQAFRHDDRVELKLRH